MSKRIICLSTYPREDASVRQRFLIYRRDFEEKGWKVSVSSIMSSMLFRMKNKRGYYQVIKLALLVVGLAKRMFLLFTLGRYCVVWINREAFPFFTPCFELLITRIVRGCVVLDIDDALYSAPPGGRDWRSFFRRPSQFIHVFRSVQCIFAGSKVLKCYIDKYNRNTHLIPTCVDTKVVHPVKRNDRDGKIVLGWIGSWSTARELGVIASVLVAVHKHVRFKLLIVGTSNALNFVTNELDIEYVHWSEASEVKMLQRMDIGLMPLEDNEWNRGKCSYKILQYMSVGIPFIASPVGINTEITQKSKAGILADNEENWKDAILLLASSKELRSKLGSLGREYVKSNYDFRSYSTMILTILDQIR